MDKKRPLRVAVLVDLPRSSLSGGHVKCWERLALAATKSDLPLELTVYFSGENKVEKLSNTVQIRQLPPVFSTENLKFILPYVPDHTDLAPYHWALARELVSYHVIHTTDGFFAFTKTAERICKSKGIPLVASFHTDTPAYTEIFTRATIQKLFGKVSAISRFLIDKCHLPEKKRAQMMSRLRAHIKTCACTLVTREEDRSLSVSVLAARYVSSLRLGVDKEIFGPHKKDRKGIETKYKIPENRIVILFVGRLDIGKNIYTLVHAIEKLIAEGVPLHLVTAGVGPAAKDLQEKLKGHVSVPGFVEPNDLAKLYASVDALALCSEVEIRSMAGVEAMASGCPVLVSEKSGIAELFNRTPAMKPVQSSVHAWVEALRAFAKAPAERESMAQEALAYSQQHLAEWDEVLKQDLYPVWLNAARESGSFS